VKELLAVKVDRVTGPGDRMLQRRCPVYRHATSHRFSIAQGSRQCLNVIETRLPPEGFNQKPYPATARQLEMIPVIIGDSIINENRMVRTIFRCAPEQVLFQTATGH
jgi:hypothetical protein